VSKPGDTFDCKATGADGSASTVTVTVKDTEGNISWALQQPQGAPETQGSEGEQEQQ
jgi:hypothetical protein